jgi:hypothetical protein
MLPLVLAQATSNPFTSVMNNPNVAMDAILALAQQYNVVPVLRGIGMALLALFALLEVYRLWIASDTGGLVVLGVKVIIVNYFISSASPILSILKTVYGYFAYAGQTIVSNALQADWTQVQNVLATLYNTGGTQPWWWSLSHIVPIIFGDLLMLLYFLVLAILFALYTFAVLASRLFIVLSIVLIPLIFPLALWAPLAQSYIGKWVSTTIHAILLPLVGAIALVASVRMGALTPLQDIAACLHNTPTSPNPLDCIGSAGGSMISGLIGSLAAIFLMFGLDGIVRSFVGGAEISTAGIIAARWAAGAPGRVAGAMRAAGAARQAAAPQTIQRETTNLDSGDVRREKITTSKIPQTEA